MTSSLKIVLMSAPSALLLTFMAVSIVTLVVYFNKRFTRLRKKLQLLEDEKQSEIKRAIIETREEERNKIASNLHDSIGAELSILKLKLSKYGFYLKNNLFIKSDSFIRDIDQLDDTINHVRTVCKDLYAENMELNGLTKSCKKFVSNLNASDLIKCHFSTTIQENQWQLASETKNLVFMVFQELMNNVIKHGRCSIIKVSIQSTSVNEITISCRHNGIRFENKDLKQVMSLNRGIGLSCMNRRTELFGGRINYLRQGSESLVNLHIPVKRMSENKQRLPQATFKRLKKRRFTVNDN